MRVVRFIIVNLCMIPSWILAYFQSDILTDSSARNAGVNNYAIDVVHFIILFFCLYGVIPLALHKCGATHLDVKYSQLIK